MSQRLVHKLAQQAGIQIGSDVVIHDDRFYDRIFHEGSLALGETYMEGWWDPKDKSLDEISYLIGEAQLQDKIRDGSKWVKLKLIIVWLIIQIKFLLGKVTNISLSESRKVAEQHYDLGNEIYEHMLDPTLTYSCAYFRKIESEPEDSTEELDGSSHELDGSSTEELDGSSTEELEELEELEDSNHELEDSNHELEDFNHELEDSSRELLQAQKNKFELIRLKLGLKSGQRVLDIGSGWGHLAQYLSENSDVKVDGITLSKEQLKGSHQSPLLQFFLDDYRTFDPGYQYDVIVSVGMFEHVNPPHYQEYMEAVDRLLKPGGLFLLHTIGGNKSKLFGERWLNTYIFPNSCLPSLSQLTKSSEGKFVIEDVHNFGPYYDKTLMAWYHNFVNNFNLINESRIKQNKPPLDQRFYRMWEYYLLICAGTFRSRQAQLYQVVLSKNRPQIYHRPQL